jgi:CubicO group peptidase (beta-lactamase class C family)
MIDSTQILTSDTDHHFTRSFTLKLFIQIIFLMSIFSSPLFAQSKADRSVDFRLNRVQSEFLGKFDRIAKASKVRKLKENLYANDELKAYSKIFEDRNNLAFLLYKDDAIRVKEYADGVEKKPLFVYSVTKSFVGLSAIAIACEKSIDLQEEMGKYSKSLENTAYSAVTLHNALKMQSGVPRKSDSVKEFEEIFLGKESTESIRQIVSKRAKTQGKKFDYNGADTDALVKFIEDVTGNKFQSIFTKYFIKKAGTKNNVYWLKDRDKQAVGRFGLMATPEDLVRLSIAYIELIDNNKCIRNNFDQMTNNDKSGRKYGYQTWLPPKKYVTDKNNDRIVLSGFGGQRIFIERSSKTVGFVYSIDEKYRNNLDNIFWQAAF